MQQTETDQSQVQPQFLLLIKPSQTRRYEQQGSKDWPKPYSTFLLGFLGASKKGPIPATNDFPSAKTVGC
jgi:hypothetical protein